MEAKENKRSVVVGIFVLIALAIFIAGIFILGGKQKRFEKTTRVKAVFDNVAGLKAGNNVWFSGVKIGTVESISFSGDYQVEVLMRIGEDSKKYIHKDAIARLGSESLIGNKLVELFGGKPTTPAVEDNDRLMVETSGGIDAMMATLQENNKNLISITSDFKVLSAGLVHGKGTAGALLTDSVMADRIRNIVVNLQHTSATTAQAANEFTRFTAKLNTPNGLANKVLTDTLVFSQLRSSVQELQRTAARAAILTDTLRLAGSKLSSGKGTLAMLLNDEKTANQLRNTMGNLEASSAKFDKNMLALQSNFLFKGYFKKQAKKEAAAKKDSLNKLK